MSPQPLEQQSQTWLGSAAPRPGSRTCPCTSPAALGLFNPIVALLERSPGGEPLSGPPWMGRAMAQTQLRQPLPKGLSRCQVLAAMG